jgi:hypothetical protein
VDGTTTLEAKGDDTEKAETWKTKDAQAKRIILRTVENSVKVHLMACKNSKEMYDMIVKIYKKVTAQQ